MLAIRLIGKYQQIQQSVFFEHELRILLDIAISVILGGLIGYEREEDDKPAGFRTNMIIAGASALFISLGRIIIDDFGELLESSSYGVDPIRMLHAVIVGVSFLGAGTILKSESNQRIRFLTTSATILMASGIGISVALKQYVLAVGTTLIVLVINRLLRYLQKKISNIRK